MFWTAQNFSPRITTGGTRGKDVQHTWTTREIRVPAVIKTWGDAVRRESLGVCHGQSTIIGREVRVGITGNSVCLAAYHWQMDFSVLRQCFNSGTAADGHTPYKARPSQNWPKITTYDHVRQIFRTSCTWFRRGASHEWGFYNYNFPLFSCLGFRAFFWSR